MASSSTKKDVINKGSGEKEQEELGEKEKGECGQTQERLKATEEATFE